jgi:D-glycero-D-manno-heptose 1,7-bisphosphate phosphatase
MLAAVGGRVDAVFFCPHTSEEACVCRKPLPGLLEQISLRFGVSLKGMACCGDSLRDVLAAVAAGCEPHLVLTGKSARYLGGGQPEGLPAGTHVHRDLGAFADFLLERNTLAAMPVPAP